MAERIRVAIRVRPFNSREAKETGGLERAFDVQEPGTVFINRIEDPTKDTNRQLAGTSYAYDHVFASDLDEPCYATQETMFDCVGMPLVENALNAYNGCVFFYGQTGSGKSHSCLGNPKIEEQKGILPRSCERMFQLLQEEKEAKSTFKYSVLVSYLEIYNEKLSDLLARDSNTKDLQVRLHPKLGPNVPGLSELSVLSYADMNDLLEEGAKQRIVAATNMNATSSRSHAILSVDVRMNRGGVDSQSRIHFVDLAGSERQKKTGAEGERLKEGIAINQSLSVLGKVISALSSKKSMPAPFRESKLTLLLKEALSGNSRTVLVACVSPSAFNIEESVSTFEFAQRCKMIATSSARNEVDRRDQIKALQDEKKQMEEQLKIEQEAKSALMSHVEQEKARSAQLELEMAEMEAKIAARHREEAESQMASLRERHTAEQAELAEAKRRLEDAQGEEQNKAKEALARLQKELEEKEAFRLEREAALEAHAKACREQEEISAGREQALRELQEERARLAEAEKAAARTSKEIEHQLEKEKQEKEALRLERERAFDQARKAEEERAQLLAEREAEQQKLEAEKAARGKIGEKLEQEIAEKEKLRREREDALAQKIRAAEETERLVAERQAALLELEGERAKLVQREQAEAAERKELASKLSQLEEDRERKEEESRQREETLHALREEQAARDAELSARIEAAAREREELQGQHEQTKGELEKAQREREEREVELHREKAEKEAKQKEMQEKLEELRRKKEEGEQRHKQEIEEAVSAKKREMDAKESEMKNQMLDLESRLESLKTDNEGLSKKALEERERRKKHRGMAMQDCPRIANLHRDPFLSKTLVFPLPPEGQNEGEGEGDGDGEGLVLGADPRCQIHLQGRFVEPEVCVLRSSKAEGDEHPVVHITPRPNCVVKVNGKRIESEISLRDADRIAITDQLIFELEIPSIRKAAKRKSNVMAEEELETALEELDKEAEIDQKWKKGIEHATHLIKHEGEQGDKGAKAFLDEAKRAGSVVQKANRMLSEMPQDRRNKICHYDLAVLLDPHGRPILSVTAMSKSFESDQLECVNVWTFECFHRDRYPHIVNAYEDWSSQSSPEPWQAWVWGGDPLDAYFDLVDENAKQQDKIESLQKRRLEEAQTQSSPSNSAWWNFFGAKAEGGPEASAGDAPAPAEESSVLNGITGILSWWKGEAVKPKAQVSSAGDGRVVITVPRLAQGGCGLKIKDRVVQAFDVPQVEEFGWKLGDTIIMINGHQVENQKELGKLFSSAKESLPIVFTVQREPNKERIGTPRRPADPGVEAGIAKRRLPSTRNVIKHGRDPMGSASGPLQSLQARSAPATQRASLLSGGRGQHPAKRSSNLGDQQQEQQQQSKGAKSPPRPSAAKAGPVSGPPRESLRTPRSGQPEQQRRRRRVSQEERDRRRQVMNQNVSGEVEDLNAEIQVESPAEGEVERRESSQPTPSGLTE